MINQFYTNDNKLKKVEVIPLENFKILTMLITDKGYVEYKNLYLPETDIDEVKCEKAAEFLKKRNPQITVEPINDLLTEENALELLSDSDVVVDCVDRIAARKIVGEPNCDMKTLLPVIREARCCPG